MHANPVKNGRRNIQKIDRRASCRGQHSEAEMIGGVEADGPEMRTSRGPTQAAASRATLAPPQCTATLCRRLRNLIGKCCGACIHSRSNASASVSLPRFDRVSRDGAKGHHARYLQIFRIIQQRDREIARLFDNPRRSHALTMLAQIRSQGLLTEDEFSSLSPGTRGAIQMLLGAG
jgi:hypothetical protein